MMFKLVPSKAFPASKDVSAFDAASAWLNETCDGFEPLAVIVQGSAARVVVSGPEGGAIVLRQLSVTKGSK